MRQDLETVEECFLIEGGFGVHEPSIVSGVVQQRSCGLSIGKHEIVCLMKGLMFRTGVFGFRVW